LSEIGFKLRGFDSKVNTQEIFLRTQDKDSSGKERVELKTGVRWSSENQFVFTYDPYTGKLAIEIINDLNPGEFVFSQTISDVWQINSLKLDVADRDGDEIKFQSLNVNGSAIDLTEIMSDLGNTRFNDYVITDLADIGSGVLNISGSFSLSGNFSSQENSLIAIYARGIASERSDFKPVPAPPVVALIIGGVIACLWNRRQKRLKN